MTTTSKYVLGLDGRKVCPEGFKCSSDTLFPAPLECVAVRIGDTVQIRDTKDSEDTTLTFTQGEWGAFIKALRRANSTFRNKTKRALSGCPFCNLIHERNKHTLRDKKLFLTG